MSAPNSKAKYRIARFEYPNGKTECRVQERWLFWWHDVKDGWTDSPKCFDRLKDAEDFLNRILPWSKPKMQVVKQV